MSFGRLIYYSAILAGWSAFVAWAAVEFTVYGRLPDGVEAVVLAACVGAATGCAVNVAAGLGRGRVASLGGRALLGLFGGAFGGAAGGVAGDLVFRLGLPRAIGWTLMGVGIGVIDGIHDRSASKLRNGLIGGALGGLIGGLLFDPVAALANSATGMSSRATALVVLGVSIGACIGLAQVVLKEAWLTVVDGYRPGRQLILSRRVTTLGRAEHVPLAFLGATNAGIGPEQLTVTRERDGGFWLEDHGGGPPAMLNHRSLNGVMRLADGDVIKLGPNMIRFSERRARAAESSATTAGASGDALHPVVPVPPPPVRQPPAPAPPSSKRVSPSGSSPSPVAFTQPAVGLVPGVAPPTPTSSPRPTPATQPAPPPRPPLPQPPAAPPQPAAGSAPPPRKPGAPPPPPPPPPYKR